MVETVENVRCPKCRKLLGYDLVQIEEKEFLMSKNAPKEVETRHA